MVLGSRRWCRAPPVHKEISPEMRDKCFHCLEKGHFWRGCTNDVVCIRCSLCGHEARGCTWPCSPSPEEELRREAAAKVARRLAPASGWDGSASGSTAGPRRVSSAVHQAPPLRPCPRPCPLCLDRSGRCFRPLGYRGRPIWTWPRRSFASSGARKLWLIWSDGSNMPWLRTRAVLAGMCHRGSCSMRWKISWVSESGLRGPEKRFELWGMHEEICSISTHCPPYQGDAHTRSSRRGRKAHESYPG